jgi:hemolysin activation/secretion protein
VVFPALHAALSGVQGDDSPIGRCLGGQGITLLLQRVQQALVEEGYLTSQVHAPEQALSTGTLLLQVLEGRVAAIRHRDANETLPKLAWAVQPQAILNLRDIEQSSDNLQRLPSLRAHIQIEPAEQPGTSDVVLETSPGRPLRLDLFVDDAGSKSTGQIQGNATLSWDDPLGLADLLYISQGQDLGGRAAGSRGSNNQLVHYSVPWGYWLLSVTASNNRYRQTEFGPYASYLFHGRSHQNELSLQRVLHRDRTSKTTATLKGFSRQATHHIDDLEVVVQRRHVKGWELSLQHLSHTSFGTLHVQWTHREGIDEWGNKDEPITHGSQSMRLDMASIHWALPLSDSPSGWTYRSAIQGQWTTRPTASQDRLCLGGRGTVRGFDGVQTLCGEQGQLWRQEITAPLPPWASISAFVALDAGRVRYVGAPHFDRLVGTALGLRGHWAPNDQLHLQWEVFAGVPLSRPKGFPTAGHTAGFNLQASF